MLTQFHSDEIFLHLQTRMKWDEILPYKDDTGWNRKKFPKLFVYLWKLWKNCEKFWKFFEKLCKILLCYLFEMKSRIFSWFSYLGWKIYQKIRIFTWFSYLRWKIIWKTIGWNGMKWNKNDEIFPYKDDTGKGWNRVNAWIFFHHRKHL